MAILQISSYFLKLCIITQWMSHNISSSLLAHSNRWTCQQEKTSKTHRLKLKSNLLSNGRMLGETERFTITNPLKCLTVTLIVLKSMESITEKTFNVIWIMAHEKWIIVRLTSAKIQNLSTWRSLTLAISRKHCKSWISTTLQTWKNIYHN